MFKRKLELLVVRGMMSGRRFPISVNGSRLGRAGSCEIAINDPILSRHHCLFEYVHGDLRLDGFDITSNAIEECIIPNRSIIWNGNYQTII